jgi:hypothetical protein
MVAASSSFRTCSITALLVSLFLCLAALYTENLNLCNVNTALSSSSLSQLKTISIDTNTTTTRTPSSSISKSKRKLPNFRNGGVVLFYHSPKTGGMSVRHNFQNISYNIHHEMLGYNGKSLTGSSDSGHGSSRHSSGWSTIVDGFLTRNRNDKLSTDTDILFLELHGPTHSVLQLYTELQRWRRLAVIHDTGFFAWSLVREPVAFSVSYFNFFWAAPCLFDSGCPYKLYRATTENLLFTSKPNLQCLYWSRSDVTWRLFKDHHDKKDPEAVAYPTATDMECQAVRTVLLEEMDWVGTTEKLSQETLPLLAYMLSSGTAAPVNLALSESDGVASEVDAAETEDTSKKDSNVKVFNSVAAQKEGVVTVESLQPEDLEYLRSINTYDQAIYDAVTATFTMDMWEDWIA